MVVHREIPKVAHSNISTCQYVGPEGATSRCGDRVP